MYEIIITERLHLMYKTIITERLHFMYKTIIYPATSGFTRRITGCPIFFFFFYIYIRQLVT